MFIVEKGHSRACAGHLKAFDRVRMLRGEIHMWLSLQACMYVQNIAYSIDSRKLFKKFIPSVSTTSGPQCGKGRTVSVMKLYIQDSFHC